MNIDDSYILQLMFGDKQSPNVNYLRQNWLNAHKDIHNYLLTRYKDSTCIKETLYRIFLNIEERPACPICGKPVTFESGHRFNRGRNGWPFLIYCSPKCQSNSKDVKEKTKQTTIEKYGVDNVSKSDIIKEKIKTTNLERYGVDCVFASADVKQKIKESLINCDMEKIANKRKETNIQKYGVKTFAETKQFKNIIEQNIEAIQEKIYSTKKKNNSFNISRKEDMLAYILSQHFKIVRQYKSEVYPFSCDFYLPDFNLYIELNGNWTHGGKRFDKINDIAQLKHWNQKAINSKFYQNALDVWTRRDVLKFDAATTNKINYLVIYPKYNLKDVVSLINNEYTCVNNKQIVVGEYAKKIQ